MRTLSHTFSNISKKSDKKQKDCIQKKKKILLNTKEICFFFYFDKYKIITIIPYVTIPKHCRVCSFSLFTFKSFATVRVNAAVHKSFGSYSSSSLPSIKRRPSLLYVIFRFL